MIPSRGLRWSSQTIGIGRRRIVASPSRQFSSSTIQNGPIRSNPLLSKNGASILRTLPRSQFSNTSLLIQNGAGFRFASTSPLTTAGAPVTSMSTADAAASSATSPAEFVTSSLDSATDFTGDSLYNIPEHIGYLKTLGLDYGWGPTALMEWTLEHVHIYAGTPWWLSITLTAILVRAVLFKAYVGAADNASKMAAVRHITAPLTKEMSAANREGNTERVMEVRQEMMRINKKAGVKIWKGFVPMLQVFTGYGTFVLLRAMAKLPVPGLEAGGALWFHNLTLPDPYLILPVCTAGVLHWVLRRGGETGASTMSPEAMKLMMWGLPAFSLLFTWWLPSALQLSFLVSGVLSYGQATLFKYPRFRHYFGMYPLPTAASPSVDGKPASSYKGTMNVRTNKPLTQAELQEAYQQIRKIERKPGNARVTPGQELPENVKQAQKALGEAKNPWQAWKAIRLGAAAMKEMSNTVKEVKKSTEVIKDKAKDQFAGRREKAERTSAADYEKKRQAEIKKERWERENESRAERAARKARQRQAQEQE